MKFSHSRISVRCLLLLAMFSANPAAAAAAEGKLAGVRFSYALPSYLKLAACSACNQRSCVGAQRKPAGDARRDCALTIELVKKPLAAAVGDNVCFTRSGNGWQTSCGPGTPERARTIAGPGWKGIYADIVCGITDDQGAFHAGAGTCAHAVISNGRVSAVLELDDTRDARASLAVVRSFRFLDAPRPITRAARRSHGPAAHPRPRARKRR